MLDQKIDFRPRFERQRRKLLAVSVVCGLSVYLGLEIDKINVLGNSFKISNPNFLKNVLWIFFGYCFLRYLWYLKVVDTNEFYINKWEIDSRVIKVLCRFYFKWSHKTSVFLGKLKDQTTYAFNDFNVYNGSSQKYEVELKGKINWKKANREEDFSQKYVVPYGIVKLTEIFNGFRIYFGTPHFSEYHLPILVAFGAAGAGYWFGG
ncbi:hypothetical protein KUV95_17300 [Microbulbifer agarilyticus]|uniref:hypothetical protein n=1 Tax=Microbulbifer agarilyticus TaxID=260552 RepID=UPI001C978F0C|nr:hypothetical protein [Microbulbifer agarilyticus]MBY6213301.1 hypothetical protein [Microbulbifer agarilyticus]